MDFFQSQDSARVRSRLLFVYFGFAIIGIIAAVYAMSLLIEGFVASKSNGRGGADSGGAQMEVWDPQQLGTISFVTLLIIVCGSGFKTLQLMRGGAAVARDLGAHPIDPGTTDTDERRLLNIVEEMAIASGAPVPEVYLMEDESINAFAAGKTTSDAVIGVTRGCIRLLNRDELQGVIAHEFSHILNGDMRLNLRIVGVLFGILLLAILGQVLIRVSWHAGRGGGREGASTGAILGIIGLSLYVIGYVGVFFAHLIKGALSRQREFLADASAVQYTRNPDGIGGALKKIGGLSTGSLISSAKAEEASHMFFANGLSSGFTSLFASHPPLDVRIKKIDPTWDGEFPEVTLHKVSRGWKGRGKKRAERHRSEAASGFACAEPETGSKPATATDSVTAGFDGPTHGQIEVARSIYDDFPAAWIQNVHHPAGAQALVFALLICQDKGLKGAEVRHLKSAVDQPTYKEARRLAKEFGEIHSAKKLALVDLVIPTLRKLSPSEYDRFRRLTEELIRSDGRVDLFEFALQKILIRHLDRAFNRTPPPRVRHTRFAELADDASVLLSTMAGVGASGDSSAAQAAFAKGSESLVKSSGTTPQLLPPKECGLDRIDTALDRFNLAAPELKRWLLEACAQAAIADGVVESQEAELLRAIADTIGVPLPPIVR